MIAANRLWVGPLREQLGRATVDLELGFEFPDPAPRRGELLPFLGPHGGDEAAVNLLPAAPGVDRLVADAEITGELGDLAPRREQVEHPTAELGRVSPSYQGCLLVGGQPHDVR